MIVIYLVLQYILHLHILTWWFTIFYCFIFITFIFSFHQFPFLESFLSSFYFLFIPSSSSLSIPSFCLFFPSFILSILPNFPFFLKSFFFTFLFFLSFFFLSFFFLASLPYFFLSFLLYLWEEGTVLCYKLDKTSEVAHFLTFKFEEGGRQLALELLTLHIIITSHPSIFISLYLQTIFTFRTIPKG